MQTMEDKGQPVNMDTTLWVVTVPAIWSDKAKQFMRDAAERVMLQTFGNTFRCLNNNFGIDKTYLIQKSCKPLLIKTGHIPTAIY